MLHAVDNYLGVFYERDEFTMIPMPRTHAEIAEAAARLEDHLARIDAGEVEPGPMVAGTPEARALTTAVIAHAKAGTALEDAVLSARRAGHSWTDIGLLIGVSRQTARERYAKLERASA